jgi:hypothetical protein
LCSFSFFFSPLSCLQNWTNNLHFLFATVFVLHDFEPENRKCIWLDSIHNQSETWIYEKRLRLCIVSLCNLLVTLETYILSLCLVIFYRWGSLHSSILLLCFKGKDLMSFMNIVFSTILKLLTHNFTDIMFSFSL